MTQRAHEEEAQGEGQKHQRNVFDQVGAGEGLGKNDSQDRNKLVSRVGGQIPDLATSVVDA